MSLLLEAGAPVEPAATAGTAATAGPSDSPLLLAVSGGHLEAARRLLRAGADVQARRRDGASGLHLACDDGRADLVRLLLEHGADVNALDSKGMSPLWLSVGRGKRACTLALLQHKPRAGQAVLDVQAVPREQGGATALHLAAQR